MNGKAKGLDHVAIAVKDLDATVKFYVEVLGFAPPEFEEVATEKVRKFSEEPEGDEPSIVDLINRGEIDVVVNTPSGRSARADGYEIRAAAVAADIALFTTIAELSAAVASIDAIREGFDVRSLQQYAIDRAERA